MYWIVIFFKKIVWPSQPTSKECNNRLGSIEISLHTLQVLATMRWFAVCSVGEEENDGDVTEELSTDVQPHSWT